MATDSEIRERLASERDEVAALLRDRTLDEVRAMSIEALRQGFSDHDLGFSLHSDLGGRLIPLLVERVGREALNTDRVNQLKEVVIREFWDPNLVLIADFVHWFVRAGFGDVRSRQGMNDGKYQPSPGTPITVRLTPRGRQLLKGSERHPLLPGALERLRNRCQGLDTSVLALLDDAMACSEHGLLRPAVVVLGVAYETVVETVYDIMLGKAQLPNAPADARAARRISEIRSVLPALFPKNQRDDREASGRSLNVADDLRRRRNDASHTAPTYGFDDSQEIEELIVSALRALPQLWALSKIT